MKSHTHTSLKSLTLAAALVAGVLSNRSEAAAIMGPNGNYYEVIRSAGITWTDANSAAQGLDEGWHLVTICDELENTFVNKLRLVSGLGQVWLGGYQSPAAEPVAANGWTWVNGEGAISTFFWDTNEPNDNYGPGSEQFLAMGLNNTLAWNDEGNLGNIAGYVIEKGPAHCGKVPEGGAGLGLLGLALGGLIGLRRKVSRR